jgi:putative FmdB family regulatory protein
MPIFEYKCGKCGTTFEKLLRSSDNSSVTCPKCGGNEVQRLMSTFACNCGGGSGSNSGFASSGGCGSCRGGSCSTCH